MPGIEKALGLIKTLPRVELANLKPLPWFRRKVCLSTIFECVQVTNNILIIAHISLIGCLPYINYRSYRFPSGDTPLLIF